MAYSAGEATATFCGKVVNGVGDYAVYPYNENHDLSGSSLTYYLPNTYTYTSVDQTFFPEGKDGNSFRMPMYGTIENNNVSFKHLGGVICLKIDKMPAESGTVTVTESANQLWGYVDVNLADATPEITTKACNYYYYNSVTFNYSNATEGNSGVFYLPVATGSYNLTVEVASNKKSSTTTHSVEMVRERLQQLDITTKYVDVTSSPEGKIINGHKFIDLGLPSGLLWAETNVGAETAYDYGNYYAWGETEPKDSYSWSNYLWNTSGSENWEEINISKYNSTDGLITLEPDDDAATANWGSGCRMPTNGEMSELCNTDNCTWAWVGRTNSAGEAINCYKVISVKNGNTIYLPASGYRIDDGLNCPGSSGFYWSSTANHVDDAYDLTFLNSDHYVYKNNGRSCGAPVRPVARP